jgi:hypothetical protein
MLRVSVIQNGTSPGIQEVSWEKRLFPSRIPGRSLVYSEPSEFHMGAYSWRLSLLENGRDVTESHPELSEAERDGGFLLPANFQPWHSDGDLFSIPTWKGHNFLYNISEKQIVRSQIEGFIDLLLWSPVGSCFLVVARSHIPVQSQVCFLSKPDGPSIQLNVRLLPDESSYFWWLKDGNAFIALYRDSKKSPPVIEFFDSRSGKSIGKTLVDPNQLVPYEAVKYQSVSRIHFSLELSPSAWCAGYFLDTWHKCHFDATMHRLSLAIYRPSGEPIVRRQQVVIPVEERWCTLQLEF